LKEITMMLKKLIPAAALLALAGAAQAQVTVYGLVDAGIQKIGDDSSTVALGGNSTTRLGVKGATDLGSGFKGNVQMEAGLDIDGGTTTRQLWAGLSSGFGEVRLGYQDSVMFQTLIGFDLNGASNVVSAQTAAGLTLLGGTGTRSVQYIAPVVGGLKVQLGYQAIDTSVSPVVDKASTAVGVTYTAGALTLAATAQTKITPTGNDFTGYAAAYDFGVFKAVANFSGTSGSKGSMVGVVAPIAGVNVGLQYARNSSTSATGAEIFLNKEVLKNTVAYAEYLNANDGSGTKTNSYAVGVIYAF
jgi:predicted porin